MGGAGHVLCRAGLGKTVQVIALMTHLVFARKEPGPYLIVVPASVLSHWQDEVARFSPQLSVAAYRGNPDTRAAVWDKQV